MSAFGGTKKEEIGTNALHGKQKKEGSGTKKKKKG